MLTLKVCQLSKVFDTVNHFDLPPCHGTLIPDGLSDLTNAYHHHFGLWSVLHPEAFCSLSVAYAKSVNIN